MSQSDRSYQSLNIKSFVQEALRQCDNYISQQASGADAAKYVEYTQKVLIPALNHYANYAEEYAKTSSTKIAKEIKKCLDEQNVRLEEILRRGQELYPMAKLKVLLMNIQKQLAPIFPLERMYKAIVEFNILPFLNQAEVKTLFQESIGIKEIYTGIKSQQYLKMRELIEYIVKENNHGMHESLTAARAQAELKDDQRTTYSWRELVTGKHAFTDLLGRAYKNITLPQYLMWRNKRDVLVVIRGYLSSQWDREIEKQEKDLQERGFTYELNGETFKASYPAESCSEWLFGCQELAQEGSCLCSRCKDDLENLPNLAYQQRLLKKETMAILILIAGEYLNHPGLAKLWKSSNIQVFMGEARGNNSTLPNPNPYFGSTRIKAFSRKWCDDKHEALVFFKGGDEWSETYRDFRRSGIKINRVDLGSSRRIARQIDSASDRVDYCLLETGRRDGMTLENINIRGAVSTDTPSAASNEEDNHVLEKMSGRIEDFCNHFINFIDEQLRYKTIAGKKEALSEQEVKQHKEYLLTCEPENRSVAGLNELIPLVKAIKRGDFESAQPLIQRAGFDIEVPIDENHRTVLDMARNQQKYYQREHDHNPSDAIIRKKLYNYTQICQCLEDKLKLIKRIKAKKRKRPGILFQPLHLNSTVNPRNLDYHIGIDCSSMTEKLIFDYI